MLAMHEPLLQAWAAPVADLGLAEAVEVNGSGNGVGTKLDDGIFPKVLPEYVEQVGIFLTQIFPTGLDRHPL